MRIDIHPTYSAGYYSMVVTGLLGCRHELKITTRGFPGPRETAFHVPKDTCALIAHTNNGRRRLVIAADDHDTLHDAHMDWADLVAKVNVKARDVSRAKVLPIGPLFGIRVTPRWPALLLAAQKAIRAPRGLRQNVSWTNEIREQTVRHPIVSYTPSKSDGRYIFFAGTDWAHHADVAPPRAAFIQACRRRNDVAFEGGLVRLEPGVRPFPKELYVGERYSGASYLDKTKRSAVVFNAPAVHGCLGWKLGEFLALGKAIVSMPLTNVMPGTFEPGEHYLLTDGTPSSLDETLDQALNDAKLRSKLERQTRAYFDEYLKPERVAARILDSLLRLS